MVKVMADVVKSFRCSAGQFPKHMHVQNCGNADILSLKTSARESQVRSENAWPVSTKKHLDCLPVLVNYTSVLKV